MNLGYGIKNYILKEEASLPSIGYNLPELEAKMKWKNLFSREIQLNKQSLSLSKKS